MSRPHREKTAWKGGFVVGLAVIAAVLEALGIGLIFAFVNALVDPSQFKKLTWISDLIEPFLAENDPQILIFLAIGLLVTFVVKNMILLGFYFLQGSFVNSNEAIFATKLFDSYLKGEYFLYLKRNSAEFFATITNFFGTCRSKPMRNSARSFPVSAVRRTW